MVGESIGEKTNEMEFGDDEGEGDVGEGEEGKMADADGDEDRSGHEDHQEGETRVGCEEAFSLSCAEAVFRSEQYSR